MDNARAADLLGVGVGAPLREGGFGTTRWTVQRWNEEQTQRAMRGLRDRGISVPMGAAKSHGAGRVPVGIKPQIFAHFGIEPYEVSEFTGNLITTAGWT